jgi:cytoskeletal protein CcmA (bactofilin family)
MNIITINGKRFETNGDTISVINGVVMVDGKKITEHLSGDVRIKLEGDVANLKVENAGEVVVNGNVLGCVDATSLRVNGNISNSVKATSLKIDGDINGGVDATSIKIKGKITGNVSATSVNY